MLALSGPATTAPEPKVTGGDVPGFYDLLAPGRQSLLIGSGWSRQHELPTGPRTGVFGGCLHLQYSRVRRPREEWGMEIAMRELEAPSQDVSAISLASFWRRYFRVQPRRAAYWEVGFGLAHLHDRLPELATRTNFTEHLAVGLRWHHGKRCAWGLEYRFQHMSNAGRKLPNIGLNGSTISFGNAWYW